MIKNFISFNKNERWGLTIWSVAILLISFGFTNFQFLSTNENVSEQLDMYIDLLDSLAVHDNEFNQAKLILREFDPNEIKAIELQDMGIANHLAERWVKYRGIIDGYKSNADIKRIYGLDSGLFTQLKPYIKFSNSLDAHDKHKSNEFKSKRTMPNHTKDTKDTHKGYEHKVDSPIQLNSCTEYELKQLGFTSQIAGRIVRYRNKVSPYYSIEDLYKIYDIDTHLVDRLRPKLKIHMNKLSKININEASAAELMELPGIGKVYSRRIIKFRDQIGSFHSIRQLLDVYGIEEELVQSIGNRITVQKGQLKKIKVNTATKDELANHPYISWDLAKRIINYRSHHFPIHNLNELIGIDEKALKKLTPYLSYESKLGQEE